MYYNFRCNKIFQSNKGIKPLTVTSKTSHNVKTYGEVMTKFHAFITLTLNGDELSASCFDRFTPRERAPSAHRKLGPGLGAKEKNP
jgi:hypothetical protein